MTPSHKPFFFHLPLRLENCCFGYEKKTFQPIFPNSDSLGLLTLNLKANGCRSVHGCQPGRCLGPSGVFVVSRWCLGRVFVVSRWCLGGVSVVSWWCLLVVPRWCLGVSVVSRLRLGGALVVSQWCHRGVSMVSVFPWCFFGGALLVCQWCLGCVFVVSWRCVCGVLRCLRDVLMSLRQSKLAISLAILMSRWCLHGVQVVVSRWNFSACRSNLEGVAQL